MAAALPFIYGASAIIGAGATAYGVYQSATSNIGKPNAPPALPEIPEIPGPKDNDRRKKAGRASTILTRPGALQDQTSLAPTLLGQ